MIRFDGSSLREGFFSRRSNLNAGASIGRCKIASCLAMTIFLIWSFANAYKAGQAVVR